MVLFHAQYPYPHLLHGGMYVRFYAIEQFFKGRDRIYFWEDRYLDTFAVREEHPAQDCTYYVYNPFIAEHRQFIYDLVRRAEFVYCQTQYYTYLITHLLDSGKAIVDLHGIPPEESEMEGQPRQAEYCSLFEREVVEKSHCLISVTEAMISHLEKKYGRLKPSHIVMPIMNDLEPRIEKTPSRRLRVVYAGDVAVWQKVGLMLDAIRDAREPTRYDFIIYTRKREEMEALCRAHGVFDRVRISSYAPKDAQKVLAETDVGFVLRDDSAVNRAACPTKLMEYLQFGVIPIVTFSSIGDFERAGYQYLPLEKFVNGEFDVGEFPKMRTRNLEIYKKFHQQFKDNIKKLQNLSCKGLEHPLIISGYDANLALPLNVRVRFKYSKDGGEEVLECNHYMGAYSETFVLQAPRSGFFAVEVIPMIGAALYRDVLISALSVDGMATDEERPENAVPDSNGFLRTASVPCYYHMYSRTDLKGVKLTIRLAAVSHELYYYDRASDLITASPDAKKQVDSCFWRFYIRLGEGILKVLNRVFPKDSRRRKVLKYLAKPIMPRNKIRL